MNFIRVISLVIAAVILYDETITNLNIWYYKMHHELISLFLIQKPIAINNQEQQCKYVSIPANRTIHI